LFLNATQIWGIKTGTIPNTPLGDINFKENFAGPRASVNTTWSIYSGGRISAAQRALAAGVDEARAELTRSEEQLDLQLAHAYFGLDLAANIERTRNSILAGAENQLTRAIRFEQNGLIPKVERLNAQVSRDEAAREQVRAQRDREIAQARLQRLLHSDTPIEPSTPLFVLTGPVKPLSEWLAVAERDNPILAALAAKRSQAEQGIDAAQSGWKPQVFAFGTYALVKHYQTLIEPDWAAGVGVNFTLFSREDRDSQVSAAREGLRQMQSSKPRRATISAPRSSRRTSRSSRPASSSTCSIRPSASPRRTCGCASAGSTRDRARPSTSMTRATRLPAPKPLGRGRIRVRRRARPAAGGMRPGARAFRLRPASQRPPSPMTENHIALIKRLAGVLVAVGALVFIFYGLYLANKPVVAPLQGQVDGRYIDISPKILGRIARLHVREGDEVAPGTLLVTLDSPEVQAKVSQAEAARAAAVAKQRLLDSGVRQEDVRTAKANWERSVSAADLAETTYKRVNALYKEGLVSQQRNDEVDTAYRSALDAANAARAQYDLTSTDFARRAHRGGPGQPWRGRRSPGSGRPRRRYLPDLADIGRGRQGGSASRGAHAAGLPDHDPRQLGRRMGRLQPSRERAGADQDRDADHGPRAGARREDDHFLGVLHQPQGRVRHLASHTAVERL